MAAQSVPRKNALKTRVLKSQMCVTGHNAPGQRQFLPERASGNALLTVIG